MKTLLLSIALFLIASSIGAKQYGYYVYIQKGKECFNMDFKTATEAEIYINQFYPDMNINVGTELLKSPYFRFIAYQKEIYVELMEVKNNGQLKRIRNWKKYVKK